MYSGITSGRVLDEELLYTKILEVNLFAFAYRLFRRDFSPLDGTSTMIRHLIILINYTMMLINNDQLTYHLVILINYDVQLVNISQL